MDVTYSSNEWRNEGNTGFGTCYRLAETKEKSEITVDLFIPLQLSGSLNSFPRRRDLYEDTLLRNTEGSI